MKLLPRADDEFGFAVVLGALEDDDNGDQSGSVYIFTF